MKTTIAISTVLLLTVSVPAFAGAHIQVSPKANQNAANQGTVNAATRIAGNPTAAAAVVKKPGQAGE